MNKKKISIKTVLLFSVVIILLTATVYLAITIQDQANSTGAINTRATADGLDDPTELAYQSTSPTLAPSGVISPTRVATPTVKPTGVILTLTSSPSPTARPTTAVASPTSSLPTNSYQSSSPTPTLRATTVPTATTAVQTNQAAVVEELPVAGFGDTLWKVAGGAGVLIIAAFFF